MKIKKLKQMILFSYKLCVLRVILKLFYFIYLFFNCRCFNYEKPLYGSYDNFKKYLDNYKINSNEKSQDSERNEKTPLLDENSQNYLKKGTNGNFAEKKAPTTYVEKTDIDDDIFVILDIASEEDTNYKTQTVNTYRENEGIWF